MTRSSDWGITRCIRVGAPLLILIVFALLARPGVAAAESLCTDTWTGPSEGPWTSAEYWSAGKAPTSADVACVPSGHVVWASGTNAVAVVQGAGTLQVEGGTFEVASGLETSELANLNIKGGIMASAATIRISKSFKFTGGAVVGSGQTVVLPSASGVFEGFMGTYTIVNEGTLSMDSGQARMTNAAVVENDGTFILNSPYPLIGEATALFKNKGTLEKTEGTERSVLEVPFENLGVASVSTGHLRFERGGTSQATATWAASAGAEFELWTQPYSFEGGTVSGQLRVEGASVTVNATKLSAATLAIHGGSLSFSSADTLQALDLAGGTVAGAGTLTIASSLVWTGGSMSGGGTTTLASSSSATLEGPGSPSLTNRRLINEGTFTFSATNEGQLFMFAGATLENQGTLVTNSKFPIVHSAEAPVVVNTGTLEKQVTGTFEIEPSFANLGVVKPGPGKYKFDRPASAAEASSLNGLCESADFPWRPDVKCGDPVNAATGNLVEQQCDLAVTGRGSALDVTRTYNSQDAAAGQSGIFGRGWSTLYDSTLEVGPTSLPEGYSEILYQQARLKTADGATVLFAYASGKYVAPSGSPDRLTPDKTHEHAMDVETADGTVYRYGPIASSTHVEVGHLEAVTDHNGNETTISYSEERPSQIKDSTGRTLELVYNPEGLVSSAKGPGGHTATYSYEGGDLTGVTLPGAAAPSWRFKYDTSSQLTELKDGRGDTTTTEYDSSHRAISQTDPRGHTTSFEYNPFLTRVEDKATGAKTAIWLTSNDEPATITRGAETTHATTRTYRYNESGEPIAITDGRGYTTHYTYAEDNRTSEEDPLKDTWKWTYDAHHRVKTITTPRGETTTITRETKGNPETIERPAPKGETQTYHLKYGSRGELLSDEDPLKHATKFEYDSRGDTTAEIDPEGGKTTWTYDEAGEPLTTVSPRGHITGAKESTYTTTIERDGQERTVKVTDPLKGITKYAYDPAGNLESLTDANEHTTVFAYNANNQLTKATEPTGLATESEYDSLGNVVSTTDGAKHITKYVRNVLGQVEETVDPRGRRNLREYDADGNVIAETDPKKRITTYIYDGAERLTNIGYSESSTHSVALGYNADGASTSMEDATGTTTWEYDELDRLTHAKDGHGDIVEYGYDLANEPTSVTYPNGKAVIQAFDAAGRLKSVTDWLEHTTTFKYDAEANQTVTVFPGGTGDEDIYGYDAAGRVSNVEMKKGTELLASLSYKRDGLGQITSTTQTGLPGEEKLAVKYDEDNRLVKAGAIKFEYDLANNLTANGATGNSYSAASELEKGGTQSYVFNEAGERTRWSPPIAASTNYSYDQSGNLTAVSREKEGAKPAIEDAYSYNGYGMRMAETVGGSTTFWAWDEALSLPLILTDGSRNYVYGPEGIAVEQIDNEGHVAYLHHDQQGSTRVITGASGAKEGAATYTAFGAVASSSGTATSPLGYDGQYTDADTGLIYLRARAYDPATAQFVSRDPLVAITREPYSYAADNPLNQSDWSGEGEREVVLPCPPFCAPPVTPSEAGEALEWVAEGVKEGAEITWRGLESVWSSSGNDDCAERGNELKREAEAILGRKHNPAKRKEYHDWKGKLSRRDKRLLKEYDVPRPRKRN